MTGMSLYDQVDRRRRRWRVLVPVVLVLAVAAGVGVWFLLRPVPEDPRVAAEALAAAWSDGDPSAAPLTTAPAAVRTSYTTLVEGLGAEPPVVEVTAVADPAADDDPSTSRVELAVTWMLADGVTWTYDTAADLLRPEDQLTWEVAWTPEVVHPALVDDLTLGVRRTTPARGEVLGEDGEAIVTNREVVDVGIQPSRVDVLDETVAVLTDTLRERLDLDLDAAELAERVEAADPDAFVDVITLRDADYLEVQDVIQPLPGTVFDRRETALAPTSDFALFTLGTVRPVTAEMVEASEGRYVAGDVGGRLGIQEAYDRRLAGSPGLEVVLRGDLRPADPVLFSQDAVDGEPVRVTLDPRVQQAAEAVLADAEFTTAIAVVRPSDGHVLALANSPAATFDIARTGQLPPGSTFKPVTTEALLVEAGVTPGTSVDCPNAITVGGRTITNAETQQLGTVPFRTAFVNSCNTAFVGLSQQLDPGALGRAAARFGIGRAPGIGMPATEGQVPEASDEVELAAAAIGQGRDLVSPLNMAGVMATIANGGFPGLALVLDPAPEGGAGVPDPLPPDVAATLQALTRGVVTEGTATLLADTPGGEVHGKTGTAEFDDAEGRRRTHAWFTGYQGDLAFAVVATDTPELYGGAVAAPIARALLEQLAR